MILEYKNHKFPAWPLLYFQFMADVWNFCVIFLRPETKNALFISQNVDSLPRHKSSNLPHFCTYNTNYQMFGLASSILSAYDRWWKFLWYILKTLNEKRFFPFFKILIHCWDTRVQSYPTSGRKIFGVAKKRRVPAEKCSYRSIEKANSILSVYGRWLNVFWYIPKTLT